MDFYRTTRCCIGSCILLLAGCSSDTSGGSGGADAGITGAGSGGATSNGGSGNTAGRNGMTIPGVPGELGGCKVFSADDEWNRDISGAAVDDAWTQKLQTMVGATLKLHPDYGNGYGLPINVVPESQPLVDVNFVDYADESDPGPYPFPDPSTAKIEGGTPQQCDGDCHFLTVQSGKCMLYEGYACTYSGGWQCSNGAKWDLTKNSYGQRPKGWTSADAAGLAITPGLVRLDEVRAGKMTHAIRFTLKCSQAHFVKPATHQAVPGSCDSNSPPMGFRVRLEPSKFDITTLSKSAQVVATAMQKYGLILADNGSNFYFQGTDDSGWTDQDIEPLKTIPASAFVAIEQYPLEN